MAVEVADMSIHWLLPKFVVEEPDLGPLLVRQVSRSLVTQQPRASIRIASVDVDLNEAPWRCLHRIGVRAQVRHRQIDDEAAVGEAVPGAAPGGNLIIEGEEVRKR